MYLPLQGKLCINSQTQCSSSCGWLSIIWHEDCLMTANVPTGELTDLVSWVVDKISPPRTEEQRTSQLLIHIPAHTLP